MAQTRSIIEQFAKSVFGFGLLIGVLIGASVAFAQYPSQSQVSKDGTAVLLEDFVSLPLSSPTHGGKAPGAIDFKGQLGRATSLRSEPADAPLAASRFFVDDQSSTLYILDKATKKFTPYLNFADIFPKFVSDTGNTPASFLSLSIPATQKMENSIRCMLRSRIWRVREPNERETFNFEF